MGKELNVEYFEYFLVCVLQVRSFLLQVFRYASFRSLHFLELFTFGTHVLQSSQVKDFLSFKFTWFKNASVSHCLLIGLFGLGNAPSTGSSQAVA